MGRLDDNMRFRLANEFRLNYKYVVNLFETEDVSLSMIREFERLKEQQKKELEEIRISNLEKREVKHEIKKIQDLNLLPEEGEICLVYSITYSDFSIHEDVIAAFRNVEDAKRYILDNLYDQMDSCKENEDYDFERHGSYAIHLIRVQ